MAGLTLEKSDLDSALYLAHAANAAYCDNPRQQYPRFAELGFDTTLVFASRPALDTFGFVAANEAHLVLAFRGTDDRPDWITNLMGEMVPWDQGMVHEGFAGALESVWGQVDQYIGQLLGSQQVWVCGHSLGGALVDPWLRLLASTRSQLDGQITITASLGNGHHRLRDQSLSFFTDRGAFVETNSATRAALTDLLGEAQATLYPLQGTTANVTINGCCGQALTFGVPAGPAKKPDARPNPRPGR